MMKVFVAALLAAGVSASALGQSKTYPEPTPAMQATIDKDNGRHFGSSPEEDGPMATDLSPAMNAAAIDKAVRKVADWQLSDEPAVLRPDLDLGCAVRPASWRPRSLPGMRSIAMR